MVAHETEPSQGPEPCERQPHGLCLSARALRAAWSPGEAPRCFLGLSVCLGAGEPLGYLGSFSLAFLIASDPDGATQGLASLQEPSTGQAFSALAEAAAPPRILHSVYVGRRELQQAPLPVVGQGWLRRNSRVAVGLRVTSQSTGCQGPVEPKPSLQSGPQGWRLSGQPSLIGYS